MKETIKGLIVIAVIAVLALIPIIIFFSRSPVLIVAEQSFIVLYGEERLVKQTRNASIALFRPIKTVPVANDAGDDIISLSIGEISEKPFCVIFPLRFANSAKQYYELNPHIPVVLLEGRFPEDSNPSAFAIGNNTSDYFIYKTDIKKDFYRAGLAAIALITHEDPDHIGNIVIFIKSYLPQAKEAFLQAVDDYYNQGTDLTDPLPEDFYQFTEDSYTDDYSEYSDQLDENDRLPEEDEQLAGDNEQPAESEQLAENGEQPPEDGEQMAESEGQEEGVINEEFGVETAEQPPGWTMVSEHWAEPVVIEKRLPQTIFFESFSHFSEINDLSCVVLVDIGSEYMERKTGIPVIFFTWMDLSIVPDEIALVIDDSPWAQIVDAVRMVKAGVKNGLISSKFHFLNMEKFNRETLRKVRKLW